MYDASARESGVQSFVLMSGELLPFPTVDDVGTAKIGCDHGVSALDRNESLGVGVEHEL